MSSNGTVLDAIQPRNFLAIIGFSASWRMWMYVAGTVPQVIAVFAIIYCFHLQACFFLCNEKPAVTTALVLGKNHPQGLPGLIHDSFFGVVT